jgi:acetaldehyde dehydrogenase (acetylating)
LTCCFSVLGCGICALIRVPRGARVANVRTVKTAVGATAVRIVWFSQRGSRAVEHLGWAHDGAGVAVLKAAVGSVWWPIRLYLLANDDRHTPARIGAAEI